MFRGTVIAFLLAAALPSALRADGFDNYTNKVLQQVKSAEGAKEVAQLTPAMITDNDRVLKDASSALIVVRTNGDRYAKLLVQSARQKIDDERSIRMIRIDRFATYREGAEQTLHVSGKNLNLYPGNRLSLDLGQVVPEELSADLRFVVDGDKVFLEPLKDARLYLLTKPIPTAEPPARPGKIEIGETFVPKYFNGSYKLYDDGRRSGRLTLKVADDGEVSGTYTSEKDGQNYEVKGKVGTPAHAIQFTITFPRTEQTFQGWMFTGDGKAIAGSTRLLEHEAGFYAVRVEE
jgi:hypothetical protein